MKLRIEALRCHGNSDEVIAHQPKYVQRYVGNPRQEMPSGLAFQLEDYLELVDWTGRQIREDKQGQIDADSPSILERLGIEPEHWLYLTQHYRSSFKSLVGSAYRVRAACRELGWKKSHSLSMCKALIG